MIVWTQNSEVTQRPITTDEIGQAHIDATRLQIRLREHRALRRKVAESLDAEEAQIVRQLDVALSQAQRQAATVHAVVGYDLDVFETVLQDPKDGAILERRPMTAQERAIAAVMPSSP